jgi:hypothetical protein
VSLKLLIKGDEECRAPWFYRTLPVLQMVQRSGIVHQIIGKGNQVVYDNNFPCFNALFIHRPHTKEDYEMIERAAKWGLKIWIDLDDNYWEIPPLNRAHNFFDKDRLRIIDNCLRLADLITVSTDGLNEYVSGFNFVRCPVETVHNGINDFVLGDFFPSSWNYTGGPVPINWRGSETHVPDLLQYKDFFANAPNINWLFWGYDPRLLTQKWGGQLEYYEVIPYEKSVLDYFMNFRRAQTDVLFVPLQQNKFNIDKSNIAALEAVWAGVYPLCVYLPEFLEFFPKRVSELESIINGFSKQDKSVLDLCSEQYLHMVEIVKEKYLVSGLEQKRFQLLEKMMNS